MKTLTFILLFFICHSAKAQQNLVPNPSFEIFDTCPDNLGQIERAVGWKNWGLYNSTPDFYNSCDTGYVNVPNNNGIHQLANTGVGFAGVYTYISTNSYREYIGIQLSQNLTIGNKYFLSFYAVLGENWNSASPTNNLGIVLTTIQHSTLNPISVNNFAHLKFDSILVDSLNWTYLSCSFIADSEYTFLSIGNFYSNLNTDTLNWSGTPYVAGYYGVDDICLSLDSNICKSIVGKNEISNTTCVIFPNPASTSITIEFNAMKSEDYEIIIRDLLSQEVLYFKKTENNATIDISSLQSGIYLLSIQNRYGISTKKFIKL